jgi:hypothetical protein
MSTCKHNVCAVRPTGAVVRVAVAVDILLLNGLLGELGEFSRGIGDINNVVNGRAGRERGSRAGIAKMPTGIQAWRRGRGAFRGGVEARVGTRID